MSDTPSEVPQDDTVWQIPEPLPLPDSINTIPDLVFRQRATDAWRAASRLRLVMFQWRGWYLHLQETGYADGGFPIRLRESAIACIKALCALGINSPTFNQHTPNDLRERFPLPPSGNVASPEIPDEPSWWQDAEYLKHLAELLTCRTWRLLIGELRQFLNLLETAPTAALPLKQEPILGATASAVLDLANKPNEKPPEKNAKTGGANSTSKRTEDTPRLSPSRQLAYSQYLYAIQENAALNGATDQVVYDWLKENLNEEEQLPSFATWSRYIREVRDAHDTNKNQPRRSKRDTGGSIVRPDQI